MLVEFAMTPTTFDDTAQANHDDWVEQIRELASSLFPRTAAAPSVIANLYGGGWLHEVTSTIDSIQNENDRRRCRDLLSKIERVLVPRPSNVNWPTDEDGWGRVAIASHAEAPIDRIVLTEPCQTRLLSECEEIRAMREVTDAGFWHGIPGDGSPKLDIGYQVRVLRALTLHADFLWLASPHIRGTSDDESDFAVELIRAAHKRPPGFGQVSMVIHVEAPDHPSAPDFPDRLERAKRNLETGLKRGLQPGQAIEVVRWPKLLDRILLGGSTADLTDGSSTYSPRWGVSMSHIARHADRGSTQQTEWKLLMPDRVRYWFDKLNPNGTTASVDRFMVVG